MTITGRFATSLLALAALVLTGLPVRANETPHEHLGGEHVLVADDGRIACRDATAEEAAWFGARDGEPLQLLDPGRARRREGEGLRIVLRGTPQLDSFPLARQVFLDAAAEWESIVGTPITVVLDVDFGPTRFGTAYPDGVIGSTDPQYPGLSRAPSYEALRQRLVERAPTAERAALYDQLPVGPTIPTTEGDGSAVYIPTSVMRALGFLPAVADPDTETSLGDPPSIGFNSTFPYDFTPANGIEDDLTDFYGVVLHEIGHALGFVSWSGIREIVPDAPVIVTTWDLFRVRPGVTMTTFGTVDRVTVSSGPAVYFSGHTPLQLSTGRPNGTGGDRRQASHWKDNALGDTFIGVMDPTVGPGERIFVTENDLDALGYIGYRIGNSPVVASLAAEVTGDTVRFTGQVADVNGDAEAASIRFDVLDKNNAPVGELAVLATDVTGTGAALSFTVDAGGLADIPTAYFGRLTITDARGNPATATVDLGLPDPGGPNVASGRFKRNKLKLSGAGFTGDLELEVNGVLVAAPLVIKANRAGTRITIKADAATLGLVGGTNRVRIYANGLRSNAYELAL